MKINEYTTISLIYDEDEPLPPFHKGDLVMYRGDTFVVSEINNVFKEWQIKLLPHSRAVNFYCVVDGKVIQLSDYRS